MKCNLHQDREAIGTCTECGIAFCDECRVIIKGKNVCKNCVDKVVDKQVTKPGQKIVPLATILSVVIPGAGQVYNGQIGKGILFLLTGWLIIPWIWSIFDAYQSAKKINEGKLPYKEALGCLITLTISVFLIVPGCAILAAIAIPNLLRAKMSANEALAKAVLRSVSTASESYAVANQKRYPTSKYDLINATPPYINKDYCDLTESGYVYKCEFKETGYEIVATPETEGTSGSQTYRISTGGVMASATEAPKDISQYEIPGQITHNKALNSYKADYLIKDDHKAFAYSANGAYGFCTDKTSEDNAKSCALEYCTKYLKTGEAQCDVLSVDGMLVTETKE